MCRVQGQGCHQAGAQSWWRGVVLSAPGAPPPELGSGLCVHLRARPHSPRHQREGDPYPAPGEVGSSVLGLGTSLRDPLPAAFEGPPPPSTSGRSARENEGQGGTEATEAVQGMTRKATSPGLTHAHSPSQMEPGAESGHFGVCVDSLTSDKVSVPLVLEKLLEHVEMHGLYTEGLYRKSGAANRTRELRQALQTGRCWGRRVGFRSGSDSKEPACRAGDPGSSPGSGRCPGEGNDMYACLGNPMDRGAWWATVHGVAESGMTEPLGTRVGGGCWGRKGM